MLRYYDVDRSLWKEVGVSVLENNPDLYEEYKAELEQEEIDGLTQKEIIDIILEDYDNLTSIIYDEDFNDYFDIGEDDTDDLRRWYDSVRAQSMTQDERILEHLKTKGKISQKGAIRLYGAYRLSAVIHRLRQFYIIETEFKGGKNRFGDKVSWAEYTLKGEK